MVGEDPRRRIPGTDTLLENPRLREAAQELGRHVLQRIIHQAQDRARQGGLAPEQVESEVLDNLKAFRPSSMRAVINATGVVIHTNLGRAPLSAAARDAVTEAAGYVDVEMDLVTGRRSKRGTAARRALLEACPTAEDSLIVNNGAAALALATAALVGSGTVIISRGELVEIGAGFRLPELIESTGAQLLEVGTTNRTHLEDYAAAVEKIPDGAKACVLKVHPSNYRIAGFTSAVPTAQLAALSREHGLPLVVDVGSGLLAPEPILPEEPDLGSALSDGADLVIASGDKLLGGPQAGLLLGSTEVISQLAKHPLARAMRTDKLTLAAMEATLTSGATPVQRAVHADADQLRQRTQKFAEALGVELVPHEGRVGGGGGAEVPLPGWAVQLPEPAAAALRTQDQPIVTRTTGSWCLLDLRCVPEAEDATVLEAVRTVLEDLKQNPGPAPGGA
ncbi:L-seryl-tRNA(Sec) selenium transferase [Nesterenkonia sp. MY13]|uniref:L-seryl-tRNA(Sec) selenium transferase n=1 Tax=Nesterenkonia sedimenti TaxID=1463632 RepID=A0A7X8TLN7_9MICC|nr:L-seryl-tRNA(Sec) selenium transferase [Nesterenkonia sedimenti]NLS10983.1 L-seryl-tRNA(Sec) selenium transferase [Nesterenkonia sedimenti]